MVPSVNREQVHEVLALRKGPLISLPLFVKILFDANTPAPLAAFLKRHQVTRTDELGWQGLENGQLLDAAEQAGFAILVTCDQNVRYQQNLSGRSLALVVLSTNHRPSLRW